MFDDRDEFYYRWLHVPSAKVGLRAVKARDEREFMEILAAWNAMPANANWVYVPVMLRIRHKRIPACNRFKPFQSLRSAS